VLATSEAGSTRPSVTARLIEVGTKDESDEKPEVEKRIGSIRAEIGIARLKTRSLEEPVGEHWPRITRRGARWTSGDAIGSRSAVHPALP
jgi:hypothetical protein